MPSFADITANKNFLSPLGYKFVITRLPNVDFFCQTISFPMVSLGTSRYPTPFVDMPVAGDKLQYGTLSVTFKVDEDLTNYEEVYNWLIALGFPDDFSQYKQLADSATIADKKIKSDASLVILSSSKNPRHEIKFLDMFPVSLTGMKFDSTLQDVAYLEATAEFAFRKFIIDPANKPNYPRSQ